MPDISKTGLVKISNRAVSNNLKYVTIDSFPDNYKEVAEVIGVDMALELSRRFGGTAQYIPKLDDIHRKVRNSKIRSEFTGGNIPELARRYELTDIQIRSILRVRETTLEDFLNE